MEAGLQASQGATGGDFDTSDVMLAGGLTGGLGYLGQGAKYAGKKIAGSPVGQKVMGRLRKNAGDLAQWLETTPKAGLPVPAPAVAKRIEAERAERMNKRFMDALVPDELKAKTAAATGPTAGRIMKGFAAGPDPAAEERTERMLRRFIAALVPDESKVNLPRIAKPGPATSARP